jgi:rhamnosyltransferase
VEIMSPTGSVAVVFITHNSRRHLACSIPPVIASPLGPRVLVVDSTSTDDTASEARRLGAEVLVIPRHTFNHGATRELARRHLGTRLLVMMTPDAYPLESDFLERLVAPLSDPRVATAYARQIPHEGAGFFARQLRDFSYPPESEIRGLQDVARYGSYTFFSSNSCAAYRNDALDEIGGILPGIVSEDFITVVRLLRRGYQVAYVADAVVQHSHDYSLAQDFRRYFDTGYGRRMYQHLYPEVTEGPRARAYAGVMMSRVLRQRPLLLPYAVLKLLAQGAGYTLGRMGHKLPLAVCRAFSAQDFYWDSPWLRREVERGEATPQRG